MNRFWMIIGISLFVNNLSAQIAEDSIRKKLEDLYLAGKFQEGVKTCQNLLESGIYTPSMHAFIKMEEGLFLKDGDLYTESFNALGTAKKIKAKTSYLSH